jgi:hypothetical protein
MNTFVNDLTPQKILKILPIDESLRNTIMSTFDSMDQGKRQEIASSCWSLFHELTNELAQVK